MKPLTHYLCRLDQRGRAVKVFERKTYQGIRRLAERYSSLFIVTAFVGHPGTADEGSVFYCDENGAEVEMANP